MIGYTGKTFVNRAINLEAYRCHRSLGSYTWEDVEWKKFLSMILVEQKTLGTGRGSRSCKQYWEVIRGKGKTGRMCYNGS